MGKKILLIPTDYLPIPNVGGGAIETLITNLLTENEKEKKCFFFVISKYDKRVKSYKYKYSRVLYYDDNTLDFYDILYCIYKVYNKVFQNHITAKLHKRQFPYMDKRMFFSYCVTILHKVDCIVNEGNWNEQKWKPIYDIVGTEHSFNHIHSTRDENIYSRMSIPNSISISNYVRNTWVKTELNNGKNYVLYNGIDINRFGITIDLDSRRKFRRDNGVNDNGILVIFCGRIVEVKGVRQLLDAFELIRHENIKLLLIGNDGFSDSNITPFYSEVKERVKKMKNVIHLGYLHNNELPFYYKCADIQVIPSIWQEGAGLVAIEGMAAGLPLITTISGGMTEYVNDNVAIQLDINSDLACNIAKSIIFLANNPRIREEMGRKGIERAKQFSCHKYYDGFIDIIS